MRPGAARRLAALAATCSALTGGPVGGARAAEAAGATGVGPESREVVVFRDAALFFAPDSVSYFSHPGYEARDDGRVAVARVDVPPSGAGNRIEAKITFRPVPKDERSVHDRWDRAGNLRLAVPGRPDLEVARFMTAYGGRTDWSFDVSHLGPLLRGECEFKLFVDTWVHPAWSADVSLIVRPDSTYDAPTWAMPIYYAEDFSVEKNGGGSEVDVAVPPGLARVVMSYLSTGHCTDGRDEDEFVSKPNVIWVDGVSVERFHPWRDDCHEYRAINPYCSRWTDGSWSSDYRRSGWCPGKEVVPTEIDLSDHLTAGSHRVRFVIENMRPKLEDHFGYWRVSACLVGWETPPLLWRN